MKYIKLLLLFFTVLLLTGCYDYKELNNMAIVMGLSVDMKDSKFSIGAKVLGVKKASESGGLAFQQKIPSTNYTATGKTLANAFSKLNEVMPKEPYVGSMKVLIISQEVIEQDINDLFDYLLRDPESRKEFLTIITKKGEASKALEIVTPIEPITSINLEYEADLAQQSDGITYFMSLDELYAKTKSRYIDAVLPSIIVKGDEDKGIKDSNLSSSKAKADTYYKGLAIFKGSKVVGYLNSTETIGYNIVRGSIKMADITFSCDDKKNYATAALHDGKSDVTIDVKKKTITVSLDMNGYISEDNCKMDLMKPKNIEKFQTMLNKKIGSIVKNTIKKVNVEYQSRALGFVDIVYKNQNSFYKKNEKNIDEILLSYKVKFKSSIHLKRKGSIVNTTKEEKS